MGRNRKRPPTRPAERREASRLTAWTRKSDPDAVHFVADDQEGSGVLRNVSTTGALVEGVSRQVPCGVMIDLYFLFGRGRKRRVHAIGKVVRETETGFAVRFSRIERELERLVLSARPKPAFAEAPGEAGEEPVIDLVDVATPAAPAAPAFPETVLRARYERLRGLEPVEQVKECIEYIGNPEILTFEFLESFAAIERACAQHEFSLRLPPSGEIVLGHFREGLEVVVDGLDGYAFNCLATNLSPLGRSTADEDDPSGVDYLGLVQGPGGGLVLGVVPWLLEFTPYSLLMRALNCLAELAPSSQIERLSRDFLGGAKGPLVFDLHVIVPHGVELDEVVTLSQLTRDLSEKLGILLRDAPQFPNVLRSIMCVRLDESAFQGRLEFDWRVG